MHKLIILTMFLSSLSVFAKKGETNYSHCQDTFTDLFNGQFIISDKHTLEHVSGVTQEPSYDLKTGIYKFYPIDADVKKSKAQTFQVLKDSEGRIRSIESLNDCKDCPKKVELAYSKGTCLPKNVFYTNRDGNEELRAEVETCKSFKELQKDLLKKMNKANKCLDIMSEYYKTSGEIAGVFESKVAGDRKVDLSDGSQELVKHLQEIQVEAKALTDANVKLQERMNSQENISSVLAKVNASCELNLGKKLLKDGALFKGRKNIYEIRKEDISTVIQKPKESSVTAE